ncbi:hypothetical protein [Krasilnikovia sp. M28-CT-15]|uniref:hypothetical protein n=1 Tax=Krasilnikovia sp. M28-CT-15 TaxID=3373540 RepID=UPI00387715B5
MRAYLRAAALGAMAATLMLGSAACAANRGGPAAAGGLGSPAGGPGTASTPAGGSPAASTPVSPGPVTSTAASPPATTARSSAPARSTAPAGAGVFSGRRQVYLVPVGSEGIVVVDASGRIGLTDGSGDRALFVPTPIGADRYLIQTAKIRVGGEASCVAVRGNGDGPAPVVTAACDASAPGQQFRFRRTGDADGKPAYTVYTGANTFLVRDEQGELLPGGTGVAAVRIGEGTPDIDTPFLLPDRGPASLPALD